MRILIIGFELKIEKVVKLFERIGSPTVRVIGWGELGDTPYWICANNWGKSWGEDGYFKFAMHSCGVEQNGMAANPILS